MSRKLPKCPKCGCKQLCITEEGRWSTEHEWDGEKCISHNNEPGSYYRVEARCKDCNHVWTLKGRTQWYCEEEQDLARSKK